MSIITTGGGDPVDMGGTHVSGQGVEGELPNSGQVSTGVDENGAEDVPFAKIGDKVFKDQAELSAWYDATKGGTVDTASSESGGTETDTVKGGAGDDTLPAARSDDEIRASLAEAGGIFADPRYEEFAIEFEKTGAISPESVKKAAEAFNVPENAIQTFIDGQKASRELVASKVTAGPTPEAIALAGELSKVIPDQAEHVKVMEWAKENLSPAQQAAYDKALDAHDATTASAMLENFYGKFQAAGGGKPPRDVTSEGAAQEGAGAGGVQGYASFSEQEKDQGDPRYASDPAFRRMVEKRIGASKF